MLCHNTQYHNITNQTWCIVSYHNNNITSFFCSAVVIGMSKLILINNNMLLKLINYFLKVWLRLWLTINTSLSHVPINSVTRDSLILQIIWARGQYHVTESSQFAFDKIASVAKPLFLCITKWYRGKERGRWKRVKEGVKGWWGYSVEGVKSPSAQRPSTTQIFSLVMSLAVWE